MFCGQYRDWKCLVTLSAVSLKDSSLLWQLPRDLCHSAEVSEPQHHLSYPDDSSLCLEAAGSLEELVWHFCEAGKDYITQRSMHNMEVWADRCLQVGLTPRACRGCQHGQHFFTFRLNCYTPNRPALSSHFPKTAVSDGSGTQVGMALGLQRQFWSCVNISG